MNRKGRYESGEGLFRTNSDGDILLSSDWRLLMPRLRLMGDWFLQTRHSYACLIARTMLPIWSSNNETDFSGNDPCNLLHVDPNGWGHAILRIDYRGISTSPGYLEIRNKRGEACMEIRAPRELALAELLEIGLEFAMWSSTAPLRIENGPSLMAVDLMGPRLDISWLALLCEQASVFRINLKWRLLCQESDHTRYFIPIEVVLVDGMMTVKGTDYQSCQLFLPGVQELRLASSSDGNLIVIAAGDESLTFSIEAANATEDGSRWKSLVEDVRKVT